MIPRGATWQEMETLVRKITEARDATPQLAVVAQAYDHVLTLIPGTHNPAPRPQPTAFTVFLILRDWARDTTDDSTRSRLLSITAKLVETTTHWAK